MTDPQPNDNLSKCIDFLQSIGIKIIKTELNGKTFLPGLEIRDGSILVDPAKLLYPGDILHEAAHIAVVPSADRPSLQGHDIETRKDRVAEELMAFAWSYAACVHLKLDPHFVFHDGGYNGGKDVVANFLSKKYIGLPMLQWVGLTADEKNAGALSVAPYPHMIKWLRD